ncbi:response regulator [Paenibacillus sp. Leaf72]|uniref:response regulator n=1 Tax=Paenibacillus sp. Leaf72 TaxID=1736234 RepID=UPI0006FCEB8A|nr:response regulator [Paenibacillus sp. Leaf72]KQO10747.1 hypothetical protein ASF12_10140 [Paenibacillus sp. Leaf72]
MYQALIAEDSKPILRNIKALLQATELPIHIAATAANGEEALAAMRQHRIDILLTDIRMPKMDGLALIEQAKLLHPQLKVVLISGYNDFEYTRKALNLQVFDYLLKPVERHQLQEVMERIIVQLKEQQSGEAGSFKDIVDPDFHAELRLGPEFREQTKAPFLIHKQPFSPNKEQWKLSVLQAGLTEVFAPHDCWVFPTQQPYQFFVLVNLSVKDKYPSAYECMEAARSGLLKEGLYASLCGQLQAIPDGRLAEFYQQMSRLMKEQLSITGPLLLDKGYSALPLGADSAMTELLSNSFVDMIRQRQKERFALKLAEQLQKWQSSNVRLAELERFLVLLTEAFGSSLSEQDPWNRLKLTEQANKLLELDSFAHFTEQLLLWTEQCFELLQNQNRKSGSELFQQIDEYVQMNMYSHVSIADLAQRFHVSPSYISRIMKKYAEKTFVHYYLNLKIKEACRLLETKPEMKIKELSDVLSFSDQHYFSKVFKEYAGCSPTEYKEQLKSL